MLMVTLLFKIIFEENLFGFAMRYTFSKHYRTTVVVKMMPLMRVVTRGLFCGVRTLRY